MSHAKLPLLSSLGLSLLIASACSSGVAMQVDADLSTPDSANSRPDSVPSDAAPAACGGPSLIPLFSGESYTGSTAGLPNQHQHGCGGGLAGEQIFRVEVVQAGDLIISTDNNVADYNVVLAVRSSCTDPGSEIICGSTSPLGDGVVLFDVSPGTYFVFVDGVAGAEGNYQISVNVRTLVTQGQNCDLTQLQNRCETGTQCTDDGNGGATCVDPSLPLGAACDPTSIIARCTGGSWCVSNVCQPVIEVLDVAPNAAFCDMQGPFAGDFVVDGDMTGNNDGDVYTIMLNSPATLFVETTDGFGGCDADTRLRIYDGNAQTCGQLDSGTPTPLGDDDDGGVGLCSTLTLPGLAAGLYYIRITYGGGGTGRYFLLADIQ